MRSTRVRQSKKVGRKQAVNKGLRQGLREMIEPPKRRTSYRTRAVSLGRCLVGRLDDVSEALPVAEGEAFR